MRTLAAIAGGLLLLSAVAHAQTKALRKTPTDTRNRDSIHNRPLEPETGPHQRVDVKRGVFIFPGHGISRDVPVWGHAQGLRIGIAPNRGPRGLIRVYAPYLQQEFPTVVNFLSIEPTVMGHNHRGQSELEWSREQPGKRGLTFWASNQKRTHLTTEQHATGVFDDSGETLRVFIHTERFANGSLPVLECVFRQNQPYEVELVLHAGKQSAPMASCVISATMGNYGLLRQIHLQDSRVVSALTLWRQSRLGELGFLPWRTWAADELGRSADGRYYVQLSTDVDDPSRMDHDPNVASHWRYRGRKAVHYWRAEADADPTVAVNGRKTYWMSQAKIPGGIAFENFELRLPFKSGQRLWFGVRPDGGD